MAKTAFGEVAIMLSGRGCTLRPSIGALCAIEARTKLSISSIITSLPKSDLPASISRIIICEGLKAAGSSYDVGLFSDKSLKNIRHDLRKFLLVAIGCDIAEKNPSETELANIIEPDWRDMFMTYVGIMERPVEEFWSITISEYALVTQGFCMQQGIDILSAARPATSQDLAEMIEQFPDEHAAIMAK